MITNKECNACGKILPLDAFGIDIQNKDGLRAVCKECHNKTRRERYNTGDTIPREQIKIKWS